MQSEINHTRSSNGLRITIIVSDYHTTITENLANSAKQAFIECGGRSEDCNIIHVAGAWELPVLAKVVASANEVDGIVALGCILTGETTHDRVIAEAIAHGLMEISIQWQHPVSMGVLTCQTLEQAQARSGGSSGNKGVEAMHAAIETAATIKENRP
ncbi:MAG: 6,7-dimethyl-8-ribityllumazine synthase [Phycisphaerales bacterium]|nr:6,7-dimethyl-8-ribityllumazine synthase [Planctomycetota bacterium]MBL6997465.1 6,7-dimethyl-8-ribityllumazine synthase [Phycisphaerales bacterium]